MDDNEKKRIRPVIVEESGESVPSIDSLAAIDEQPTNETVETSVESSEPDNIISEETKDPVFEEATPLESKEESRSAADIGIMQPQPIEPEKKKGNKLTFVFVMILVALVVALLAGGVYVYTQGTGVTALPDPTPLATEVPSESPEPTATPTEKVDVSKLKVSILNGSGKIGEAGKAKTAIEKQGFKVTNTGNAATFDFEETVIQVKEGTSETVVNMLKDSLAETYKVEVGENLKTTSTYDVVITVGSK
jgi:hypothetical protein